MRGAVWRSWVALSVKWCGRAAGDSCLFGVGSAQAK